MQNKIPTFATQKSPNMQRSLQAPIKNITLVVKDKNCKGGLEDAYNDPN
ncbi:hypothetical protein [Thermovenabulum gondwanense]|nr:hypothetical protein [Thermovenabulum gondwanense]